VIGVTAKRLHQPWLNELAKRCPTATQGGAHAASISQKQGRNLTKSAQATRIRSDTQDVKDFEGIIGSVMMAIQRDRSDTEGQLAYLVELA
jgi:hypothetical protein